MVINQKPFIGNGGSNIIFMPAVKISLAGVHLSRGNRGILLSPQIRSKHSWLHRRLIHCQLMSIQCSRYCLLDLLFRHMMM